MTKETEMLEEKIDAIMQNHIPHLTADMAEVKTNLSWLMKFFWIIATSSIGALITGLITLLNK